MTRRLTRLADLAYRRRGRMVLGWIVATILIIGIGSSLAGEFEADYDTPGSESEAASDITKNRFGCYSARRSTSSGSPRRARTARRPSNALTSSSPRPSR